MAGLLAWAADVVVGGGASDGEDERDSIPALFTEEQRRYARELDRKAAALGRSIQDLRARIPPQDIAQRLPHLHAHSLASNAALALQLNSHSTTREQTQLREVTLQEENAAYEKAILNCENKVKEKMQEADALQRKLVDMDENEENLTAELENAQSAIEIDESDRCPEIVVESKSQLDIQPALDAETSKSTMLENLESKKKELSAVEEKVKNVEKRWALIQENALKQPSPAQREKILDKQLHSLLEQLAAKQGQAEALVTEVHEKEKELERLNGLWKRLESNSSEVNATRNRFGRSMFDKGSASSDYIVDGQHKPLFSIGRWDSPQRPALLRASNGDARALIPDGRAPMGDVGHLERYNQ
ncbi:uncharacterized protein LOC115674111 isoform X2 [Syzygium oleosum]|uniref:uncharacterized protein LOC115674111 isoform X2 n=1 Tax=Syzygium oleosum TaxID=219896 RepID=UPI0024B900BA|nr:uncharacterized protein LOC115674111 isoform X2 [Syzygium oleosum]